MAEDTPPGHTEDLSRNPNEGSRAVTLVGIERPMERPASDGLEEAVVAERLELEDGIARPALVREVKLIPPFNYSLVIHEGRKRQVRRMLAALGHRVLALKRIRIGSLSLGDLEEGEIKELNAQIVRRLLKNQPGN